MYRQTLLILGGILLVCAVITVYVVWSHEESLVKEEQELVILPVTYTSTETGKWVDIRFYENSLVLNGIGFSWLDFAKVPIETEAKYENKEENLVLKLEGETVTLVRGRQTLFVGTSTSMSLTEPNDEILPETASTTALLTTVATTSETAAATSTEAQ
jgi:hypothetical protein